jgi:hypothetical protein
MGPVLVLEDFEDLLLKCPATGAFINPQQIPGVVSHPLLGLLIPAGALDEIPKVFAELLMRLEILHAEPGAFCQLLLVMGRSMISSLSRCVSPRYNPCCLPPG